MKIIEIIVAPDGTTKVQTKGFQGASCRDGSRFVEDALGSRLNERVTAEFHQQESVQHRQQQQS
jgi:hypothetical protein